MPMLRAIIFDFDGLIVDTETPALQAWQEVYASYGEVLDPASWAPNIGTNDSFFDPYEELAARVGGASLPLDDVRDRYVARRDRLVGAQPVLPGVRDLLAGARERGMGLGVASSSSRAWVLGHLERLGLVRHFDAIRCRDDVERAKPDPELYRSALQALGVSASEAAALEDSPAGVLAAVRAGVYCVAVPNPLTRVLALEEADLRLDSLADLPLETLARVVADRASTGGAADGS